MIYRLEDLCESQDFEHDQKFVKAQHWKEACDDLSKLRAQLDEANECINDFLVTRERLRSKSVSMRAFKIFEDQLKRTKVYQAKYSQKIECDV